MSRAETRLTSNRQTVQQEAVQADRADTSIENLCLALVEFQKRALQEIWNPPRRGHVTKQVQSPRDKFIAHECEDIAFQKISEWADHQDNRRFYNEPALLKRKQMFDIMMYNKEGFVKEFTFIAWRRKIHKLKIEAASTATEHAKSPQELETRCFKSLALDLLSNHLLPEQLEEEKYKIHRDPGTGDIFVTNAQRSWINAMLRRNLGDYRVAYFIFSNGIPSLSEVLVGTKTPSKALLQNMFGSVMTWHASLQQIILERQNHPDMAHARQLAALDQGARQRQRRERK
jgi:hypothetical protein